MKKIFLSALLAFAMVLTPLPGTALAAPEDACAVKISPLNKTPVQILIDPASQTAVFDGSAHTVNVDGTVPEKSDLKYEYRQYRAAPGSPWSDWTERMPENAGSYGVRITAYAGINSDEYADNTILVPLTVSRAAPNTGSVTAGAVPEGTPLSGVVLTPPAGVTGEALAGRFVWDCPDTTVTEDGLAYRWTFYPDDPNYTSATGSARISLTEDIRRVSAAVYNLPGGGYAVVDIPASHLTAGDVITFYRDASCTGPVSAPAAVTAADGAMTVALDAGALDARGGVIYAKVSGAVASAAPVSYPAALDFTAASPLAVKAGGRTTVSVAFNGGYTGTVAYALDNPRYAEVSENGVITGKAEGTAALTVTVTFAHPDQDHHPGETIVLSKAVTVEVTKKSGGGGTGGYPVGLFAVQPANGTVSTGVTSANANTTVTVTTKPENGYVTGTVEVTDANGNHVAVTDNGDGTWSFTMPEAGVNVSAAFVTPGTRFGDLDDSAWYREAIAYVFNRSMMNGVSANRFGPSDVTSRGMIATILYRLEGKPETTASSFTDVAAGQYYAGAVAWAAGKGVVTGYGDGTFKPNNSITREELAVMLWRYAGKPAAFAQALAAFSDAGQVSGYAKEAMAWAVENGIINGKGGNLVPQGDAIRAEAAAMLMRFCQAAGKYPGR